MLTLGTLNLIYAIKLIKVHYIYVLSGSSTFFVFNFATLMIGYLFGCLVDVLLVDIFYPFL